jgi:hypothetical protein
MRRLLPTLLLAAGCAGPDEFRDDPSLSTAERRELNLRRNLRDDRSWEEQERLMADVKTAFGGPSDADALGPKGTPKTPGPTESSSKGVPGPGN